MQRPHGRCGGTLGRDCTAGAGGPWAETTQQAQDGVGGTLCRDRMAGGGWGGPCIETARQVWGGETLCRDRTAGAGGPWAETTQQARWGGPCAETVWLARGGGGGTLCRDRMAGAGGLGSPGIPLGPWSLTGGDREPQTPAPDTLRGEGGFAPFRMFLSVRDKLQKHPPTAASPPADGWMGRVPGASRDSRLVGSGQEASFVDSPSFPD